MSACFAGCGGGATSPRSPDPGAPGGGGGGGGSGSNEHISMPPAMTNAAFPTSPPAQICGSSMLNGPATAPAGAMVVHPTQNLPNVVAMAPAGTTFWLAPGTYTLGSGEFDQIQPKDNDVFIGAPGAILDGKSVNLYAFTQHAQKVTIRYLTIQNFGPQGANHDEGVVNHDGASGWTVEYNTIQNNAGAGLFIGSDNVVRYNCLINNQQYGFSMYDATLHDLHNITLDHNEIAGNNTYDWEAKQDGCGCTGGGKFWDVQGATVTNNWVHHNKSVGLWADTDNTNFLFDGNYINDNNDEGIFYEISYNARISNNTFKRNALVKGKQFASGGDSFPVTAIYLSESGGDSRVAQGHYATLEVTGNYFEDNWGGVTLWENADRFCNSPDNTSDGYCTMGGAATLAKCVSGTIAGQPYLSDCRWKTQNISVTNNELHFNRANVGCTTDFCGQQAILSNWGTDPSWSPYKEQVIQDAITFKQNNHFANNIYFGDWIFTAHEPGNVVAFSAWQAAPYGQDSGSSKH